MLEETASRRDDRPLLRLPQIPVSEADAAEDDLRQYVAAILAIQSETFYDDADGDHLNAPAALGPEAGLVARFQGRLRLPSDQAYAQLDEQLAPRSYQALFRATTGPEAADAPHSIYILSGRTRPQPRAWWPNLVLFLVTLFSVLLVGTTLALETLALDFPQQAQRLAENIYAELWRGIPYAISIMLILGAHEMGHYLAARWHKLAVTLPYFIPLPFLNLTMIGTMGAFIQLRQPLRDRRMLFDVGAAGPLAGLVFAIPILLIGLAGAQVGQLMPGMPYVYEGDSLLYAAAKTLTFGRFLPSGGEDVLITSSQLAWAGWTGLLVTALNLIPIGQLDGGHVMYALFGKWARALYLPVLLGLGAMAVFLNATVWFFWVVLMLFFGRAYAVPLDDLTPLDNRRRALAVFTLIIFALIFVPAPMTVQVAPAQLPFPIPQENVWLPAIGLALALRWRGRRG